MLTCHCGKTYFPNQAWLHECCAPNAVPNNLVPNKSVPNKSSDYLRVKVWREANRERHREYMKEYMREKRLKPDGH
jgi:hypothetical protein